MQPGSQCAHARAWLLATLLLGTVVAPASGQRILPQERPGDAQPPLPSFEQPSTPETAPILPPFPIPDEEDADGFTAGMAVEVRRIEIEGNTVLPSAVLQEVVRSYEGRRLSYGELQTLRDRLTLAYVERGYATSGATLPEQRMVEGVLRIVIIEGRVEDIDVDVDVEGRFRPSYFRSRLAHSLAGVLDVAKLQQQLQIFQQDPQVASVRAQLEPTAVRGVSQLRVVVREASFYDVGADFDNYRSPAIGSLGGGIRGSLHNVIGLGDTFSARFTGSEGLRQAEARFDVPLTVWDTRFEARYQYSQGEVIDGNFAALGIESEAESVSLGLTQPLYRTERMRVAAALRADWRRAQSFLFGGAIGLPTGYDEEGKSQVSVMRFGLDASYRTRTQSMVFRSLLSWGLGVLGATNNPGAERPSGHFVAWLGQLQWASRLPWWDAQLLTRLETQLAADPLLPLEQFAVGGRYTVRGYRENTLVRDNGLIASLELRVPLYRRADPAVLVELAPFADVGRSWNEPRELALGQAAPQTIGSVGVGARISFERWGFGELYWGHRLEKVALLGEPDLQDDGIHFRLGLSWP